MLREVTVCDRCQDEGVDRVAAKTCCICGKDYCEKHTGHVSVQISVPGMAVHSDLEVCIECRALVAFDNFTTGDQSTRAAVFDRPIIKMMLPDAIAAVKRSLIDIHHSVDPSNIRDWITEHGGES